MLIYQGIHRELELNIEKLKGEKNNINSSYQKESRIRQERDRTIEHLENVIQERDKEIRRFNIDIDSMRIQKQNLYDDNGKLLNELNKLKDHIYLLSDQNQKVYK